MRSPDERFTKLMPLCQRAVRRALWHCQQADQEDALQVGLTEVWLKLNDPATAANTDSWFIWRTTMYAKDYATRQVYRYQQQTLFTAKEDDPENEAATDGGIASMEESIDATLLLNRLRTPQQHTIARLLMAGWPRTAIATQLQLSYKAVIWQCTKIAAQLV